MLSRRQREAARMIFEGRREEEVAEGCGVLVNTVRRWARRPAFGEEMKRLEEEGVRRTRQIVRRYGFAAAAKLVELLQSEKAEVARRAALDLLDRCLRVVSEGGEVKGSESPAVSEAEAMRMLMILAEGQREEASKEGQREA